MMFEIDMVELERVRKETEEVFKMLTYNNNEIQCIGHLNNTDCDMCQSFLECIKE